jgi:hypothetical protein
MATDLYFRADIARTLIGSVAVAVETAQANGHVNLDHLAGILTLAKGTALSFGIPWSEVLIELKTAIQPQTEDQWNVTLASMLEHTVCKQSSAVVRRPRMPSEHLR